MTEAVPAKYPTLTSSLTTYIGTRVVHIPLLHPHALPYNPTQTELYIQETNYQFQLIAIDYTKDHLCSGVTKALNPYDLFFENNFDFVPSHFSLNQTYKNIFVSIHSLLISSFYQILSSKKLHQYSYENFCTHLTLHTNRKHNFVNNKFSSAWSPTTKKAFDSSYLHGRIQNHNHPEEYFIYFSETNPNRLLIVPRETLPRNDPHFYVYQCYPLPALTTLNPPLHLTTYRSYSIPKNHSMTSSYNIAQLHLSITKLIYYL